jgi:hypothetical protein
MPSVSIVESAETSPRTHPAKCCKPALQAMVHTDQKKMTDGKGKMKQSGHSRDEKAVHSMLAVCLEEGPGIRFQPLLGKCQSTSHLLHRSEKEVLYTSTEAG